MNHIGPRAPDPASSGEAPGAVLFSLLEAAHRVQLRLDDALAAVGLSLAKYRVLSELARAGGPPMLSELAAGQGCVRSNMTQLVDRLEADGLVRRVSDPADRRAVRAALTPLGEERQAAGTRRLEKVQAEIAASLSEADRAALGRALSVLG